MERTGPRKNRTMHNDTARRNWIDRLFQREEMDGDGRCETYLVRWTLLKLWGGIGVYLHHFVGDDWSRDLHDHPKRFISIGLWGSYVEETPTPHDADLCGCENHAPWCPFNPWATEVAPIVPPTRHAVFNAPWVRTFPASHIHRIRLIGGRPCWTIVIVLRTVRRWGFWHRGRWFPWRQYVNSDTATRMKSCP